jgi:hypothetical protein
MATELHSGGATGPAQLRASVFVSYAREDLQFADQLVAALTALGLATVIDRKGIHGAENWKRRLGQLILESDVIVFVLTPASAVSSMCQWEVDEALRLKKRVVPVLAAALGDVLPSEPLRDLNYIHFYPEPADPGSGFGTGLASLATVLSVDIEWIREHTRIGALASRWHAESRPADQLSRGSELTRSMQWRDTRPQSAPELTTLQREFLQAGEDAEKARTDAEREQLEARSRALATAEAANQEKRRALATAEAANQEKFQALERLTRRNRLVAAVIAIATVVLGAIGWFAYTQAIALQDASAALEIKKQEAEQSVARLEGATLRLREGMKLKIADTDHTVLTTEKWYRIATDYKLAVGTYRAPLAGAGVMDIGTGFLVSGDGLRAEWAGRVVFITASHVIRGGMPGGSTNLARASIAFPGIGDTGEIKPSEVLFESGFDDLDVAVLGLAGPPPRHAVPVDFGRQVQTASELSGIAVLHWTAADGFTLGFGHGVSKPDTNGQFGDDRMYYTHVTGGGASGAPVFDANSGSVVCLHVAGITNRPRPIGVCTSAARILAAITSNSSSPGRK